MRKALSSNPRSTKPTLTNGNTVLPAEPALSDLLINPDPLKSIQSGKLMARSWSKSLNGDQEHLCQARTLMYLVIDSYWRETNYENTLTIPKLILGISLSKLDESLYHLAKAIGIAAAKLPVIEASYHLGNVYTAILPQSYRSGQGIFYTPPSLTGRLLDMVHEAGVDWSTARIIDPACGGGAFLAPIALRMRDALKQLEPRTVINHIESHLTGCELDGFGAWMSQVFLEIALKETILAAGVNIGSIIRIGDSLQDLVETNCFDAVIGNPPYGKLKLNSETRKKFERSLYGHANLYGLFTDLALQLVNPGGVIGYLTPTSFLSGEYFKKLRQLLLEESRPMEMDFVLLRKGVFEDVLQETMLSTYVKKPCEDGPVRINQIETKEQNSIESVAIASFSLPAASTRPWLLARLPEQAKLVVQMHGMHESLADWGYKVSTGPLVWNRHKEQLQKKGTSGLVPVIWAESITPDGRFVYKTDRKNHAPFFKFVPGDEWLLTNEPCILLQRTTAKEQHKRLIAAALPALFIDAAGGVIVENHLNMIVPIKDRRQLVSQTTLSAFLNSKIVNDAFRCISGSVAVSAYELESLPLPSYKKLKKLETCLKQGGDSKEIESICKKIYC